MRPTEPGMTAQQAARFRKKFRWWCDEYGVTNADLGHALDAEENADLRGQWKEGGGVKAVSNAMVAQRKLTHVMARRLVVALLLSQPVIDADNAELDSACIGALVGHLVKVGALPCSYGAAVPSIIAPLDAEEFARETADVIVRNVPGIGRKNSNAIARSIEVFLKTVGPLGARAYCDRETGAVKAAIEESCRERFGPAYVYSSQLATFGREFNLLDRVRPIVTKYLLIPMDGETA